MPKTKPHINETTSPRENMTCEIRKLNRNIRLQTLQIKTIITTPDQNSRSRQRGGRHNWNNTFYLVSALQIPHDMDPQTEE